MSSSTRTGGREATKGIIAGRIALSVGKPRLPEPPGFQWTLLSDLARMESGHTPSRARQEYWNGEVPWIGIRDATGNHGKLITDTLDHVTESGLEHSSARLLPEGTVCLSRTASVGFVVQMGRPMATSQDFVNWVCGPELNSHYLRYILMLEQESVRRFAHGTTHQTMYYPEAKALNVLVPERPRQDAIVEVLGSLDDKIAANDRFSSIVDEIAAAEFARTCRYSRQSTLDRIGEVDVAVVKPEKGGTLRYLDISAVGVGRYSYPALSAWDDAPGRARRALGAGDTVWSTVRPNRRAHALVLDDDSSLVASTGLAVLTPRGGRVAGLYEATRTEAFAVYLESVAEGSAYPAVRAERFRTAPIPDLDNKTWDSFEAFALPLRRRAHAAVVESRRLVAARDELLPLLMSGKVHVKDAVEASEGVL